VFFVCDVQAALHFSIDQLRFEKRWHEGVGTGKVRGHDDRTGGAVCSEKDATDLLHDESASCNVGRAAWAKLLIRTEATADPDAGRVARGSNVSS
jgi:hypothetical protein